MLNICLASAYVLAAQKERSMQNIGSVELCRIVKVTMLKTPPVMLN